MSEASAGGGRRTEVDRRLVQRSLEDEDFRQRLLDDPKGTIEQELGSRLPESIEVRALEESAQTIYLVLPSGRRISRPASSQTRTLRRWPAETRTAPSGQILEYTERRPGRVRRLEHRGNNNRRMSAS